MRILVAFFLTCAALMAGTGSDGRLSRDLGQGLMYVRVRTLPADLPLAPPKPAPIVLDLRYTQGGDEAAAALQEWIGFRATARTPVFLLVNGSTAPAVLEYLDHAPPHAGLLTIGLASSRFVPDLALAIEPATDRAAYDALDHGATVESLITDQPDKPRHDEAEVVRQHTIAPESVDESEGDGSDTPDTAAPVAPAPLIDTVLQRAIHLHRALLALKRI
ncbi:MAG: hypothetical protein JSR48_12275 [Verrucomicrobia bacterium]|nr:hypothetical protein [Verrucomicrobiota bacterium]